jgi:chromosome partitioning protein
VLLLDADPQGGSTLNLGLADEYRSAEHTLFDVVCDVGALALDDLDEIIVADDEFDVVPAHIRNFSIEKYLYSEPGGYRSLRTALDRLDRDYDHVIIDTPPNLSPLTDGALLAAGNVLFPSLPNVISRHSLELLFEEIETLEDKFDDVSIRTLGAVLNRVPPQGRVADEIRDWFHETFGEEYVFEIGDRDCIEHAIEYRSSIYAYDPEDAGYPWDTDVQRDLCTAYDRVVDHIDGYT